VKLPLDWRRIVDNLAAMFADQTQAGLLQKIADNPFLVLLGYVLTVLFGVLSVVLYFRGKKEKRPQYCTHGSNLFQGLKGIVPGVSVHFPGHSDPIPRLSVAKLLFWNQGKETIRRQDIVKGEPIRIVCNAGKILQANIIDQSEPSNRFSETVSQDHETVTLNFDYMDPGNGVTLQIFHTAPSDKQLEMRGKIVGAKEIFRSVYDHIENRRRARGFYLLWAGLGAGGLSSQIIGVAHTGNWDQLVSVEAMLCALLAIYGLTMSYLLTWHRRIPIGFEKFEE
jgi:preprotein translocase subunit SecG